MHTLRFITALAVLLFAGCSGKEAATEKPETAPPPDEGIVTLTKENLQQVAIKTQPVGRGPIAITLKAAARVSENANKTAKVASTLEGRIARLNFDLNDPVKTGDVLGLVQTPELLGRPLEIKAPIDGIVVDRKSTVGEQVGKEKEIYTISDPTDLWVLAEIKERDIGSIKVGQEASFTVIAYPDETFRGKVARIGNEVEAESRTVEARIETNNAERKLKPGMFADVEITTTVIEDALVIPENAVQSEQEHQIVFIALGGGRFEKRVVKIGLQQGGLFQVLKGAEAGEQLVTEGSFILKSEMLKSELQDND